MLIDSHCHLNMLDLSAYPGGLDQLLEESRNNGLEHVLCIGVDLENAQTVIDIAQRYEDVSASVGVHPSEKLVNEPTVEQLINLGKNKKVIAIGETGLDYYYNKDHLENMRERFRIHIRAAKELKKPLIIHSRNAQTDTIQILKDENASAVKGVMHCFTESFEMAQQALDLGFYISFSGIITFKNAHAVAEVAQKIPLEKILIETDAPYLTPVPFRGKPNYPHYVKYVAEKIAELKNVSYTEVVENTAKNFNALFRPDKI